MILRVPGSGVDLVQSAAGLDDLAEDRAQLGDIVTIQWQLAEHPVGHLLGARPQCRAFGGWLDEHAPLVGGVAAAGEPAVGLKAFQPRG